MPLPKMDVPTYEINLISNNKNIEYRPFLVKEEKLLLMALETKDKKEIIKGVYSVLQNCILTKGVNIEELPSFDVEYLFLKIREKSLGEKIEVIVRCPDTKKSFQVDVNLLEVKVEKPKDISNKIEITNKMGIILKYPSFKTIQESYDKNNSDKIFDILLESIDTIYDENTSYTCKEYSKKELQEFVESLPQNVFIKLGQFFEKFPQLVYEKDVTSPFTGNPVKVRLDSFIDFFD